MMCRLSEICEFNPREYIPKGRIAKKVPMDALRPFCRDISAFSLEPYNGGTKFRNGDTLMARITPCLENGKTAKVEFLDDDEVGFGSTEYIVLRAIKGVCDPDFLFYLVRSPSVRAPAIKSMVGTSGRQRVQTDVLEQLVLDIPPLPVQQRIGNLLKSLDDKIELNLAINRNLEEQMDALFAHEFLVDKQLLPGWERGNLLDIADYLNGLAMQKNRPKRGEHGLPVLKIRELRQGFCDASSEECSPFVKDSYIVHDGDVIFSWSGSLLVDIWCGGTCGLNQHLFKVTSQKYDKWFYYAWTKHYLERFVTVAADKATTMGHIKRDELSKAKVLIPPPTEYERIGALLSPLCELIISNRVEARRLTALRDTLLPRLMSGELDVSECNI